MKYSRLMPYGLAALSALIYLLTAAPFMLWLDAPRFVAAIVELGVANPPEPAFILLAKPFTFIPFGSYILRLQIFQALIAAVSLILTYKLTVMVLEGVAEGSVKSPKLLNFAGLFSLLTLAFSYQFWSQSQNVETFILVTLIEVLVLLLLLRGTTKKRFFINMSLIALLLGLSTGTNPVIASIVPSILWFMWGKRKYWSIPGFLVWIAVGTAAVIAIHLYIPIRAAANPFLNYWRAVDFEGVWNVSTGAGLNVYVPDIGRINGFTLSPEIFFGSTWNFIKNWFLKFTPLMLPFMILGGIYLWQKSKFYFIFLFLTVFTNWFFAGLYYSGNQESWFLVSDVIWVILAGAGFLSLVTGEWESLIPAKFLKSVKLPSLLKYKAYILALAVIPGLIWFPFLNRRSWVITEDYIKNLYKPMGDEKAILFGSSDLYDSISFYTHDIPGTSVYKPNVIPITDNLLYILKWYRENLKSTTDLQIPDDSKLVYDRADEYSRYVNDFFDLNLKKYKIFISVPALRNNFLYAGSDLGPSFKLDETRFKLIPRGMLYQVVDKDSKEDVNPDDFNYTFQNKSFPNKKPFMLEKTYNSELTGVLNEYAYSLEGVGDYYLKQGKSQESFDFYQRAYNFNPKNAEIISRLGNFYGSVGDHTRAAEYFEKALKIEPRNIGLLFNLAIAYENTGRADKAMANLNKVLQFSKSDSQIGQLAKTRLQALKQATGSATLTNGSSAQFKESSISGGLQQQLLPQQISNQPGFGSSTMNLQFSFPQGFSVSGKTVNTVKLSNNLAGKDELSLQFYSQKLNKSEKLDTLESKLPFKLEGAVLITQPVNLPGFSEGSGKTYGSGEHLTFLLLLRAGDFGYAIKIYPGDTSKTQDFNAILQSIKTIN